MTLWDGCSPVQPGDVPGVSQGLPQRVLLRVGLLAQEPEALRGQQGGHHRAGEVRRAASMHLVGSKHNQTLILKILRSKHSFEVNSSGG